MAHYATRRPARFASRFLALCDFCHACPLYYWPGGAVMGWIAIASIIGRGVAIAMAGAGAFVIANYALDWL
jgi:hypothetical protein